MPQVKRERVTVWSEGSRVAAEIFKPEIVGPSPAILLCQGWGGTMSDSERYALHFAGAGYLCMTFDYRTWGASDGKLLPASAAPILSQAGEQDARIRVIREVVDPLDQIADVRACLAYLLADTGADTSRVGLWGTSYGCGHVLSVAGTDDRIKAVVVQVGVYGHSSDPAYTRLGRLRAEQKARGLLDPAIPQGGMDAPAPALAGTPDMARIVGHRPLDFAARIRVPTLFIDAEQEEYGDAGMRGAAAFEVVSKQAHAERRTLPCTHYEIYNEYFDPGSRLAAEWFEQNL